MVSVSASVNLPLHYKVQKFSSGSGSPGWSRKKCRKTVVMVVISSVTFPIILKYNRKNIQQLNLCLLFTYNVFNGTLNPTQSIILNF